MKDEGLCDQSEISLYTVVKFVGHNPNNVGQFSQGIIGTSSVDHIEELNNPMSTTYLYVDANSLNLDLNEENLDLESRNTDETDRNLNTISTFINLPPSLPTNLQPESTRRENFYRFVE